VGVYLDTNISTNYISIGSHIYKSHIYTFKNLRITYLHLQISTNHISTRSHIYKLHIYPLTYLHVNQIIMWCNKNTTIPPLKKTPTQHTHPPTTTTINTTITPTTNKSTTKSILLPIQLLLIRLQSVAYNYHTYIYYTTAMLYTAVQYTSMLCSTLHNTTVHYNCLLFPNNTVADTSSDVENQTVLIFAAYVLLRSPLLISQIAWVAVYNQTCWS